MHSFSIQRLGTGTISEEEKDEEDTKESRRDSAIEVLAKEMPKDSYSSKMLASPQHPLHP